MSVRARAHDGSWHVVRVLGLPTPEMVIDLLGDDVGDFFDLGAPAPVMGVRPCLPGSPDAVCITAEGEVAWVVILHEEDRATAACRLTELIESARSASLLDLSCACDRVGRNDTAGTALARRLGHCDAARLDRMITQRLQSGPPTILVVMAAGVRRGSLPAAEVMVRTGSPLRCYEILLLGAGPTRLVECCEVEQEELDSAVALAEREADAERMLQASSAELGMEARPLIDALLHYSDAFFTATTFRSLGDLVIAEGWLEQEGRRNMVLAFDSAGSLTVHIGQLQGWDQRTFLQELEAISDFELSEDDRVGPLVRLSLIDDFNDCSLVERFLGTVSDAFLPMMCDALLEPRPAPFRSAA